MVTFERPATSDAPQTARSPAATLRAAIMQGTPTGPACAVGAVNAVAARVAVEAGFDALWLSGLELSAALGLPDANLLGIRDITSAASVLTAVAGAPVLVDVDNAGGTPLTARRFARELRYAGVAGVCIEDSQYPKTNSFNEQRRQGLADIALVRAQVAEIRDVAGPDLVVIGRTESLISGEGLDCAFTRADSLVEAGADAVLIHSRDRTGDEALAIANGWRGSAPLATVTTAFRALSTRDLGAMGFRLCIFANQLTRVALAAMRAAADYFADHGTFEGGQPMASMRELLQVADPKATASL